MSVCCLLVILLCFMRNGILLEVNGESCTEGFMDYSLLQGKAAAPLGSLRNKRLAENTATRWIIIEDSMENAIIFTCATVITEILIGVDIRTVNDNVGRNLYPKFELWAPTDDDDVYTREMSVEIRLTPDNFTTNGQYLFTLPTPLSVSIGYRIGVYQPPDDRSVVRFHYTNRVYNIDETGKVESDSINDTNIKISGLFQHVDYESLNIQIYPIEQDTSCYKKITPPDNITLSYSITDSYYVSDTRIFPDIRFTCHGIITNWIVYAPALVMPVIKIRHSNGLTTTATTLNTRASNAVRITSHLYNFTMSNEITVQPGDILMIESDTTNQMFYQQYNGPHNYRLGDNNELTALDTNDYPLISVVVDPISVTTTVTSSSYITVSTISSIATSGTTSLPPVMPPSSTNTATSTISSTHINTVITVLPSSSIYSTATVTMESMEYTKTNSISSISLSVTSTPVSTLQSTGNNILILAGSISAAVFILLVVTILVILIVSVLVCRRRLYQTSNRNDTFSSDERKADINQQSDVPSKDNKQNILIASTNPAYGVTGERCNTNVSANPAYGVTGIESGVSANPAYGITKKSGVSANPAYGINTRGMESIYEEPLVYDEPRTMYHEQQVITIQNGAYEQIDL